MKICLRPTGKCGMRKGLMAIVMIASIVLTFVTMMPAHAQQVDETESAQKNGSIIKKGTGRPIQMQMRQTGYSTSYGKNKVQLAVHLRRAGFAFEVLGRGFVTHFPHQRSTAKHHWLHSNAHRRVDRLFGSFGRELASRYAGVTAQTPLCSEKRAAPQRPARTGDRGSDTTLLR